jgi:hypothetical protein
MCLMLIACHGNNDFANAPQCYVIRTLSFLMYVRQGLTRTEISDLLSLLLITLEVERNCVRNCRNSD